MTLRIEKQEVTYIPSGITKYENIVTTLNIWQFIWTEVLGIKHTV